MKLVLFISQKTLVVLDNSLIVFIVANFQILPGKKLRLVRKLDIYLIGP